MSNPVPDLLALTSIADGAPRLAAPIRNNFSAIQTADNEVITALSGGAAGQALEAADASHVVWAYPPGYQIDYAEQTVAVTVTATSSAAANTVAAGNSVAFDGSAVWVEFYCTNVSRGTSNIRLHLYEDGTNIGQLAFTTGQFVPVGTVKRKLTPAAGAHTFAVKAYVDGGSGSVAAGPGGGDTVDVPAFIRITKA